MCTDVGLLGDCNHVCAPLLSNCNKLHAGDSGDSSEDTSDESDDRVASTEASHSDMDDASSSSELSDSLGSGDVDGHSAAGMPVAAAAQSESHITIANSTNLLSALEVRWSAALLFTVTNAAAHFTMQIASTV